MKPGPMLANVLKGEPRKGSVFEPKLDGHRVIVQKVGDTLSIYSRTFHDQSGKLPHLEDAFRSVPFDFTLDGEIVSIEKMVEVEGQQVPIASFSGAQSVMGSGKGRKMGGRSRLTFVVFDCLSVEGKDITDVPDALRRGLLEQVVYLLSMKTKNILLIPRWAKGEDPHELFEAVVGAGGEGLMVKNPLATYKPSTPSKPSSRPQDTWSKMKAVSTADVVITGYKPGEGKYRGMVGSVGFGQYKNGVLIERSFCSGMDDAMRRHITDHQDDYLGRVMEVRYFGRVGPEESFRHPNFVAIRQDKLPQECEWE